MEPKATLVSMMSSINPDINLFTPYFWSLVSYFRLTLQPPNRLGLTSDQKQSWSAWWALPILMSNFLPPPFDLWSLIFLGLYNRCADPAPRAFERHRLLSLGTTDFWAPWVFGGRGRLGVWQQWIVIMTAVKHWQQWVPWIITLTAVKKDTDSNVKT